MFLYMCCLCIPSYNSGPPQKYQTGTRAHGYLNPPPPPRVPVWDKGTWLPESPSPPRVPDWDKGTWLLESPSPTQNTRLGQGHVVT